MIWYWLKLVIENGFVLDPISCLQWFLQARAHLAKLQRLGTI